MKLTPKRAERLVQFGFLFALLGGWYLLTTNGDVNPLILPKVTSVWSDFSDLVASGKFWSPLKTTLYEYIVAMCIAAPLGMTVGYLVSRSHYSVRVFDPLFAGMYSIPAIVLLPVYILYFGLGVGSKMAIGATIGFFPVVLNTIAGFSSVDPLYIRAAHSMGAKGPQMFWGVMVPAAFPVVLTGLRICLIIGFLAILGTETIASLSGLGHQIVSLAELLDTSQMFAYIVFAVSVAVTLNIVVSSAERRWRRD